MKLSKLFIISTVVLSGSISVAAAANSFSIPAAAATLGGGAVKSSTMPTSPVCGVGGKNGAFGQEPYKSNTGTCAAGWNSYNNCGATWCKRD